MVSKKIMIVEDEMVTTMDLRLQLAALGYVVDGSVFSGGQAIAEAIKHKPDLIIMDIVLKGDMDGISAAQRITDSLHIPVILLTAHSDAETLKRIKSVSAYGYLIKPFQSDELHSSIEVALYKHHLERRLKDSEQWFAKTLHCTNDAVIATDTEGKIQFMNSVAEAMTGRQLKNAKDVNVADVMTLLSEKDGKKVENPIAKALRSRAVTGLESSTLQLEPSKPEIPLDASAAPIIHENGKLLGAVLVFRDTRERKIIEKQVRDSEERFHSAFTKADIGLALVATDGRFLQVNDTLAKAFGYTEAELLKTNLAMLTQTESYEKDLGRFLRQLLENEVTSFHTEIECQSKTEDSAVWMLLSASMVRDEEGLPLYFIIQFQNTTEPKYTEQKNSYLTNHDPLTGLMNRTQFHDRFTYMLSAVQRHGSKLALMFLDLDRFKLINNTLSHRVGDLLLQAVSERLKSAVRNNDLLARLDGDEFVLLLDDIDDIDSIARIGQKLIEILSQPFSVESHDIFITASIGISIYPNDGSNSHDLLKKADTAMYMAKESGKNNFKFYSQEMTARSLERMTVERGLRHGLDNYGFKLHFQPQIDCNTGRAKSVEALVRMEHPEWGLLYPDRFINIAEETGLIVPIGQWVLGAACAQVKAWQLNDAAFNQIAVNISARQFADPNLLKSIKAVLDVTGIKPSSLELEITESAMMQDPKRSLLVLEQLRDLGVRLSIDDFGMGYSSLTYLRQFPVHSIKIDKSFVQSIANDNNDSELVLAIIALAHQLKLSVTAEGVETEEQYAFLKENQCDFMQGFLFSRPETANHLERTFH